MWWNWCDGMGRIAGAPGHGGAVGDEEEPVGPVEHPESGDDAHGAAHGDQEGEVHPGDGV